MELSGPVEFLQGQLAAAQDQIKLLQSPSNGSSGKCLAKDGKRWQGGRVLCGEIALGFDEDVVGEDEVERESKACHDQIVSPAGLGDGSGDQHTCVNKDLSWWGGRGRGHTSL